MQVGHTVWSFLPHLGSCEKYVAPEQNITRGFMRFRIKNQEGSSLKFRLTTRDDDLFNFILNEKFKGSITTQITSKLDRAGLEAIAHRIMLFLYDVDNPRNGETTPEEHTRIREGRNRVCSKETYIETGDK